MKKLIYLQEILVLVFMILFENLNAQNFILSGTVTGKDTGFVTLRYFRDGMNKNVTDTAFIKRGKFQFSGEVTDCEFAQLYIYTAGSSVRKKYDISFFITPGDLSISFKNGDADKASIKGSKPEYEYRLLKKRQKKQREELHRLDQQGNSARLLFKNAKITSKELEEKIGEINKSYVPVRKALMNDDLLYIKQHPGSYVSLLLLYTYVGMLSTDSIDNFYAGLSDKIKGSSLDYAFLAYNARVRKALAKEYPFDKVKLDIAAPPFMIKSTITEDSMYNSTFIGKVVILEFWGINCLPCLKANPILEEMRKEYGTEKLEIIAINDDSKGQLTELINYINKNKFSEWIQVFTNEEVTQKDQLIFKGNFTNYIGLGVPRTFVIDKTGQVVYKNYGYSADEIGKLKLIIAKLVAEGS